METAETCGVRSEDAQQRASDIGCESWCRGGTAGQYLLTRALRADTIEAQKKKRRIGQLVDRPLWEREAAGSSPATPTAPIW